MINKTNDIVAVIPARSGSKGVPDKNIKPIQGEPLIAYSVRAALKSKLVDRVIVSTDSDQYAEIAQAYGAEVPFRRPKEISQDNSTDIEFFNHIINWMQDNEGAVPSYFVHLRPTTPLRDPQVIDEAIRVFVNSDNSALRSAHKMSESSYKAFEINQNTLTRMCNQGTNLDASNLGRQTYPVTYDANGYVDVVRTEMIINEKKLHGDHVMAYLTERSYEVDEESDIELLEYVIQKNPKLVKRLFSND